MQGAASSTGDPGGAKASSHQLTELFRSRRLSPVQRRIAQYVLENLPDSAFLSSIELAERSGVSQPSVTRFAIALGFAGYPEFRDRLRRIILPGTAVTASDVRFNELQSAVDDEIRNVDSLHQMLADTERMATIGAQLAESQPLVVLGLRASAALAGYFGYFGQRIHPDVRLLTGVSGGVSDGLLQARDAGAEWVLGFVMPRYPREATKALSYARGIGLRTAVITDGPIVPFAADVDLLLPVSVGSGLVFDSYAAPIVLAMALLHAMAGADPRRSQARLEAYEQMAEQERIFIP